MGQDLLNAIVSAVDTVQRPWITREIVSIHLPKTRLSHGLKQKTKINYVATNNALTYNAPSKVVWYGGRGQIILNKKRGRIKITGRFRYCSNNVSLNMIL